ncbi:MAG: nucleotide exchange factor GrpE [Nitrospirae bacterium RBG_16_64_22]|nr:MAG: nucleotide exchange factor GrpE [Nitrospirae bacterium RBG_16_64_22]
MDTPDEKGVAEAAQAESPPPAGLSPEEERDALREALAQAEAQAAEARDRLLRAAADFDNTKKRIAREQAEAIRYGNEAILREILSVADNLGFALSHAEQGVGDSPGGLVQGVELTYKHLLDTLARFGVTPVESLGKPFDPACQQAMSQIPADVPENTVVQEIQKGYRYNDRLLRPALVIVSKRPGETADADVRGAGSEGPEEI